MIEPHNEKVSESQQSVYAKTKTQISFAVTAKLISAFVFATRIVQFLWFLNPKLPVSNHILCLYSLVCVGPVRKPHFWFSHDAAHTLQNKVAKPSKFVFFLASLPVSLPALHEKGLIMFVDNPCFLFLDKTNKTSIRNFF